MAHDAELDLMRRLDWQPKCANPFCEATAPLAGEFCAACIAVQRQTRDALRRTQAERA